MTTQLQARDQSVVRRWLQLDEPTVERSEAELTAEMQRNYRWNFTVNLLDGAFFWFGQSFISSATILPLFLSKVTTEPLWVALLAVLGQASWYLPQLFTAGAIERYARKKPFIVNLGLVTERLPVCLLPVAAWLALDRPWLALLIFFLAYVWYGMGAGAVAPAWSDMIAGCFPVQRRGWFFGLSSFIGVGLGALGAAFSSWLLTAYPFPTNFVYAFSLAAGMITFSWCFIALTRETVRALPLRSAAQRTKPWHKIGQIWRTDHNFRRFLLARLLANLSGMGAGFLTISALERWGVPDSTVGLFTAALLIGQTVGSLAAGLIADRVGHKRSLQVGLIAAVLAYALAWLAAEPGAYYLVFALIGCGNGIAIVSGVLIPLEFSPPDHRPTYVGIANTATGIGYTLAPLLGGVMASVSYSGLFALSALLGCAAFVALSNTVREPRSVQEFAVLDGA